MKITQNFSLEEFLVTNTGLPNKPNGEQLANIHRLARKMQIVRGMLGHMPITITSGYRSAAVNTAVGGSKTSDHLTGHACDFRARGWTAYAAFEHLKKRMAKSMVQYDQMICYFGHVHISFDPEARMESWRV